MKNIWHLKWGYVVLHEVRPSGHGAEGQLEMLFRQSAVVLWNEEQSQNVGDKFWAKVFFQSTQNLVLAAIVIKTFFFFYVVDFQK